MTVTTKRGNWLIKHYLNYYNRIRRHSANGWVSPEQYEQQYYQNEKMIEVSTV